MCLCAHAQTRLFFFVFFPLSDFHRRKEASGLVFNSAISLLSLFDFSPFHLFPALCPLTVHPKRTELLFRAVSLKTVFFFFAIRVAPNVFSFNISSPCSQTNFFSVFLSELRNMTSPCIHSHTTASTIASGCPFLRPIQCSGTIPFTNRLGCTYHSCPFLFGLLVN